MRISSFSMMDIRLSTALKLLGILASICLLSTILLANAFPQSWVALWPGTFALVVSLRFAYLLVVGPVKELIVAGLRAIRSGPHFEDALEAYTSSLELQLDGVEGELKQLRLLAAELDWKVKVLPKKPARRALSPI